MNNTELQQWLDEEPPITKTNPNGSLYIPIENVLEDLTQFVRLYEDVCKLPCGWSSFNFRDSYLRLSDNNFIVSGSIEISVRLGNVSYSYAGTATFNTANYPNNPHWASILKSLAITNAVMPLGIRFGKGLNKDFDALMMEPEIKSKLIPDDLVRQQYKVAKIQDNFKLIESLESKYNFHA